VEETDKSILVSTATEYGGKLLEEYIRKNENGKRKLKVISERLNEEQMKKLIQKVVNIYFLYLYRYLYL